MNSLCTVALGPVYTLVARDKPHTCYRYIIMILVSFSALKYSARDFFDFFFVNEKLLLRHCFSYVHIKLIVERFIQFYNK